MAQRRRQSDFGINVDGLTDSVTNLAGALVLLVVLLIGVTSSVPPASSASGGGGAGQSDNVRQIDELLTRVTQLRVGLKLAGGRLQEIEQELPLLEKDVDEFYENK